MPVSSLGLLDDEEALASPAAHEVLVATKHKWKRILMDLAKTGGLFILTAIAEILGCYLPYLWLQKGKSPWLLIPAAVSLAIFSWLLTLHPAASGRIYAAYGGVYVTTAIVWLWAVDGIRPTTGDWVGAALCLAGMFTIVLSAK